MRNLRAWAVTLLVVALTVKTLWWVIEPVIPLLIVAVVLATIIGGIYTKATRW